MNKEFYYQIKSKRQPNKDGEDWGIGNWDWPPLFSGKVAAENSKEAKEIVCHEYGKRFPVRVLLKDLETNEFLLHIKEIKETDHWTKRLWEAQECPVCKSSFSLIEKFQWGNPGGSTYCSEKCNP